MNQPLGNGFYLVKYFGWTEPCQTLNLDLTKSRTQRLKTLTKCGFVSVSLRFQIDFLKNR